jgi:hypothetical protein
MGIPTGEELLESLRDGRLPFIDGDRERMSRPIRALPQRRRGLAQLYDMRAAWARKLRPRPWLAQRVRRAPAGSIRGWTGLS